MLLIAAGAAHCHLSFMPPSVCAVLLILSTFQLENTAREKLHCSHHHVGFVSVPSTLGELVWSPPDVL